MSLYLVSAILCTVCTVASLVWYIVARARRMSFTLRVGALVSALCSASIVATSLLVIVSGK